MNERSQDFMFTAQSCLYCFYYLTCDNSRKDFDSQECHCEYKHKRCKEETCDTCCDYSRCLFVQYPTCDDERVPKTTQECGCDSVHDRYKEKTCKKCCDFYNKIISCKNCLSRERKCEWSRIMCKADFRKGKVWLKI